MKPATSVSFSAHGEVSLPVETTVNDATGHAALQRRHNSAVCSLPCLKPATHRRVGGTIDSKSKAGRHISESVLLKWCHTVVPAPSQAQCGATGLTCRRHFFFRAPPPALRLSWGGAQSPTAG